MGPATGYEHFEAEGEVRVRAWAPDRARAFALAACGVFALLVEPDTVADRERREVRAQGATPEALLLNWITEGLYVQEIEGFAVRRVEVTTCSDTLVHGFLHGEPLAHERHHAAALPRAPTPRRAAVLEADGRFEATLVVRIDVS